MQAVSSARQRVQVVVLCCRPRQCCEMQFASKPSGGSTRVLALGAFNVQNILVVNSGSTDWEAFSWLGDMRCLGHAIHAMKLESCRGEGNPPWDSHRTVVGAMGQKAQTLHGLCEGLRV